MQPRSFLQILSSDIKAIKGLSPFTLHFILVFFILTSITTSSLGQKNLTTSFLIVFKKSMATKDGYILNGYVVNIAGQQADSLDNHEIRVSGEVTIIKGIGKRSKHDVIVQGRAKDTRYILNPIIEIIK